MLGVRIGAPEESCSIKSAGFEVYLVVPSSVFFVSMDTMFFDGKLGMIDFLSLLPRWS